MKKKYDDKEVEKIIEDVKSHLTGDTTHDLLYLNDVLVEYEDDSDAWDLREKLAEIVYDCIPDEITTALREYYQSTFSAYSKLMPEEEARNFSVFQLLNLIETTLLED